MDYKTITGDNYNLLVIKRFKMLNIHALYGGRIVSVVM